MDDKTIIGAIAEALKDYSSLKVQYLCFAPLIGHTGPAIRVNKIGYRWPMFITHLNGTLRCRVWVNYGHVIRQERGGAIDLIEPDSFEQLLALLKRDLK